MLELTVGGGGHAGLDPGGYGVHGGGLGCSRVLGEENLEDI